MIDAAIRLVRARGYEGMTIRNLADELGVAPMSLYRHVRDKDDVLDEVVDRLLDGAWQPSSSPADWQAWIADAADRLRRLLVTKPVALHVYLTHPVVSPAAVARMDAMMAVLRDAIGEEDSARRAYGALHTYTLGFAALEASRAGWTPRAGHEDGGGAEAELADELAAYTSQAQFSTGLRYLLEGIARDAGEQSSATGTANG